MDTRRYTALAIAVLALAAFNLTFRVGSESLTEWDSSLYANSALDMVESGDWVGTSIEGDLDYYNSKPPLNVWLIALSIKAFGASLFAVRIASVVAAWLTVLVLLLWASRRFTPGIGLFAALVLATCFGFLHVHSGRSANPDAALTLLLLLIVITLDGARQRPWRRVWLGPLLAGVFLLKGMAVMLPLLLITVMELRRWFAPHDRGAPRDGPEADPQARPWWPPLASAFVLAAIPVTAWAVARWRVDEWRFFEKLFLQDFVALSTTSLDGQGGSPLFYLNILQKHHYDWIIAAITVAILFRPSSWATVRRGLAFWRGDDGLKLLLGSWVAIALLVPSLMQTKLPWYLNPLYPMFALGVGWAFSYGFSRTVFPPHYRSLLIAMIVTASVVAEAKLLWYSYNYRGLEDSVQGLLLVESDRIRGTRVFRSSWNIAEMFVLRGLVQAERVEVTSVDEFLRLAREGEYLVMEAGIDHPKLVRIRVYGAHALYQRRD